MKIHYFVERTVVRCSVTDCPHAHDRYHVRERKDWGKDCYALLTVASYATAAEADADCGRRMRALAGEETTA